ncbi:DUF2971 domain-containing protein [Mycobacterium sp. Dal123C01]|uniref:DUF2971 domain-containing protein n=1 Tax=Mycobacterium sp. Dal123C01 TaxID=3457577 RepID=UPI00403ECF0E
MDDAPSENVESASARHAIDGTLTENSILETPDLYHYTSIDGLFGILEKKQLWATHASYLNDTGEFTYGLGIVLQELESYRKELNEAQAARDEPLLDWRAGFIDNLLFAFDPSHETTFWTPGTSAAEKEAIVTRNLDLTTPFVSCLSTERDQLSQWRGYARGGYSIRFDSQALQSSVEQVDPNGKAVKSVSGPYLSEVLYDADESRKEIRRLARAAVDAQYTKSLTTNMALPDLVLEPTIAILTLGSRVKNHKFHEESEYRIIIVPCIETFRQPSVLGITPRTALSFDTSAIKEIMVGPSAFGAARRASIRRYLTLNSDAYPNVEVSPSEITYREL